LGEIVIELAELWHHFLQLVKVRRIEEQINVRELRFQLFLLVRDHAASKHDWNFGPLPLQSNQRIEFSRNLVFGRLPHDA
jgi:hypothetical protein